MKGGANDKEKFYNLQHYAVMVEGRLWCIQVDHMFL